MLGYFSRNFGDTGIIMILFFFEIVINGVLDLEVSPAESPPVLLR